MTPLKLAVATIWLGLAVVAVDALNITLTMGLPGVQGDNPFEAAGWGIGAGISLAVYLTVVTLITGLIAVAAARAVLSHRKTVRGVGYVLLGVLVGKAVLAVGTLALLAVTLSK